VPIAAVFQETHIVTALGRPDVGPDLLVKGDSV